MLEDILGPTWHIFGQVGQENNEMFGAMKEA